MSCIYYILLEAVCSKNHWVQKSLANIELRNCLETFINAQFMQLIGFEVLNFRFPVTLK